MKSTLPAVTKEQLYDEFNTVVTETEQLLKSVAAAGNDQGVALKSSITQGLAAAGNRLEAIRQDALDQARAGAQATDEYVQANPWRSVGVVAALAMVTGLVAGIVISRR
jgi:ElaB/YqjD/DUF883 family membrane-anchored ribosome-binding protein